MMDSLLLLRNYMIDVKTCVSGGYTQVCLPQTDK